MIQLMTTGVYWAFHCNLKLWYRKRNKEGQLSWEASVKKGIEKQEQKEVEGKFERSGIEQLQARWNKQTKGAMLTK